MDTRGLYLPIENVPTECMKCDFRDAEYSGACDIMPGSRFGTYEEQFAHCPFNYVLSSAYLVEAPLVPFESPRPGEPLPVVHGTFAPGSLVDADHLFRGVYGDDEMELPF